MSDIRATRRLRPQAWFDTPDTPGMSALCLQRFRNSVPDREELQDAGAIVGIAGSGSDLAPCNKTHVFPMDRVKAGIPEANRMPMEFSLHPIRETGKRPPAALDLSGVIPLTKAAPWSSKGRRIAASCVGYWGSAEAVNLQPPDARLKEGVSHLPTLGDGRRSGTSESPSILNATAEAAVGGGLGHPGTGDVVRLGLDASRFEAVGEERDWPAREAARYPPDIGTETPWQEFCRAHVGQLGGCPELATAHRKTFGSLSWVNH